MVRTVKISSTANKRITSVSIDPQFLASADAEELEDLLLIAKNKVLEQADNVHQIEMQASTPNMMGGLCGLFGK